MISRSIAAIGVAIVVSLATLTTAAAQSSSDPIGLAALRLRDPTLIGTGVNVAQVEAGGFSFEVNPAAVEQRESLFTWISSSGTATTFPNSIGGESGHANEVGRNFYGQNGGVAPGVQHVDNYEAGYFYNNFIAGQKDIGVRIVNQSFIFSTATAADQRALNAVYDRYVVTWNTIFVSGVGNGGSPNPPATAYNGIAVAAFGGASSVGPTGDGRSKPDITAPAGATSFSTPLVSGAAGILVQAGNRDDGGIGTAAHAVDARTVKALLLNGAVKPADWFHTTTSPLDPRYGAGILNVNQSHLQLQGGEHSFSAMSATTATPPAGPDVESLVGWDYGFIETPTVRRGFTVTAPSKTHHYYFTLTGEQPYTLTSTLTWFGRYDIGTNSTVLNNLDLVLLRMSDNTQQAISASTVDNVEHLFVNGLTPGRYALQVVKQGSLTQVSSDETYAVAFAFTAVPEPSSMLLLVAGTLALAGRRRRP